jgi:hypothetical protein
MECMIDNDQKWLKSIVRWTRLDHTYDFVIYRCAVTEGTLSTRRSVTSRERLERGKGQNSITAGQRERNTDASSFSMVCRLRPERAGLQPRVRRDDGHSECA